MRFSEHFFVALDVSRTSDLVRPRASSWTSEAPGVRRCFVLGRASLGPVPRQRHAAATVPMQSLRAA